MNQRSRNWFRLNRVTWRMHQILHPWRKETVRWKGKRIGEEPRLTGRGRPIISQTLAIRLTIQPKIKKNSTIYSMKLQLTSTRRIIRIRKGREVGIIRRIITSGAASVKAIATSNHRSQVLRLKILRRVLQKLRLSALSITRVKWVREMSRRGRRVARKNNGSTPETILCHLRWVKNPWKRFILLLLRMLSLCINYKKTKNKLQKPNNLKRRNSKAKYSRKITQQKSTTSRSK